MKTPKNVYKRFIDFEERAAAVYLHLASRFRDNAALTSFWLDMALEEKRHAGLLQFCMREELFAASLPGTAEMQRLTTLFRRLEKRAMDPQITINEAFSVAIELEYSEMNAIYSHLTTATHSSMYLFKRKIATLLPGHVKALVTAAAKFGAGEHALKELKRLKTHYSGNWRASKEPRQKAI